MRDQIKALIVGIESRITHTEYCASHELPVYKRYACSCSWPERVQNEIARTIERMIEEAIRDVHRITGQRPEQHGYDGARREWISLCEPIAAAMRIAAPESTNVL